MTTKTTPDGRPVPPPQADERTMLESFLDFHRATLALKCADLDDSQVRVPSAEPSAMTLLGLVQHMAQVERKWFQEVFAGQDGPPLYTDAGRVDGFTLTAERGMDEAMAVWKREVERGREATAGASLDDTGTLSRREAVFMGTDHVSLRWILIHMIEEYARHNGHADLLRERIDGVTGT
ncbi:putative damage-inducible protein DinB [Streptomyces sp. Amel2xB2]|uniref:DinB family protein n=1 Tax=Streptomyces sp. Amel2xB2 TaxID=1305829 RepID=UPI000DB95E3C|nr:DinB family protein [Streptomyces sp. Amel2xB2]RAJ71808.1 putative damage-inducible protein DinB [Streptomyces sp. Amel2xB2]